MTRLRWEDLPPPVREAVTQCLGEVFSADPVQQGAGSETAFVLHTHTGRVFLKGVELDGPNTGMGRIENKIQPYLPSMAPRLMGSFETAGWLVLLFEYVPGRHADLSPGSADLPVIAALLHRLSQVIRPDLPVLPIERRWAAFAPAPALDLLRGDTLVHTDLTEANILIGNEAKVIDWAWPTRGAPWLDTAFLVVRLVQAGHSPADAERWASQVPAWREAGTDALHAFIIAWAALGEQRAPGPVRRALARWAAYRADARAGGVPHWGGRGVPFR
ncbi:hypothetical protein GCM10023085_42060 [Actinomadura viridis]|uniref:Aminoglycoside phosphotransferase n=1 Tax=Actinomadura viridis TaxID=58110 RepID=A0A931DJV1_9ACTN|nr:hypothetical protein [Actinomadura viridis]MBG6092519.1 hypothetical protein [Actinomadura viridis]